MSADNINMRVGDWVKGKTRKGELIYGYIVEKVEANATKVELKVIQCDNARIVGNIVQLDRTTVERLDTTETFTHQQLEELIDLALKSRDEEWFMELTGQLKRRRHGNPATNNSKLVKNKNYEEARD
ncbi:IDEAL domain-containing protein [Aquibacillus salsiterrae]|uniref:IDEAL domain-containing protein n=1 Tax=Aquibacillus salsiterrae TaxID=2950439 RepID=A0A9X3WHX7_9BACI|nr:IDEAL domain-containing protein [Aquibacillus salsiterrae]MDC3417361.1 IDEAL domain-containing protein [Aquibacillus salsiterrae]